MEWLIGITGAVGGLVILVLAIGALLPKQHVVIRRARFKQSPEVLWQTLTDAQAVPSWHPDVQRVDRLPDRNGHPVWLEVDRHGEGIPFEIVEAVPPRRLVRRIADPKLPFGGSWTVELTPVEGGCEVTLTERGEVYNPIFRFVSRFIMGHKATMDAFLNALGKKFGEAILIG